MIEIEPVCLVCQFAYAYQTARAHERRTILTARPPRYRLSRSMPRQRRYRSRRPRRHRTTAGRSGGSRAGPDISCAGERRLSPAHTQTSGDWTETPQPQREARDGRL